MTEHDASASSALSSDILVTDYTPSGRHSSEAVNGDFGGNTPRPKNSVKNDMSAKAVPAAQSYKTYTIDVSAEDQNTGDQKERPPDPLSKSE
jgi:hypothetical protein